MNIFKTIWFYVVLAAVVVVIAIGGSFVVKNDTKKIEVNVNEDVVAAGCVSINITPVEGATEYSFDGGKTWQKSNYGAFYENGTYEIMARDENGKTLSTEKYKVDSIPDGVPTITLDFDKEIESTDEKELLDGVFATNNYFDITDKLEVEVMAEEDDYAIVKYSVENSSGKRSSVFAKLHKIVHRDFSFQLDNYSCVAGKTIQTYVKTNNANLLSYVSSDESIAKIENSDAKIEKCEKCVAINIKCLKTGTVTLSVYDEMNNRKEANVTVTDPNGAVIFDKKEYSCVVGETITAQITATAQGNAVIKSFTSSDQTIASLEKDNNANCNNCTVVKIKCIKKGSATIKATSSTNAQGQATIKVNDASVGTISYDKNVYKCDVGKTIEATITATGEGAKVASYTSSNTSIATITKHPTKSLRCMNCILAEIKCIKAGTVTLTAKSSTGATTQSTVNVVGETTTTDKGSIAFKENLYTCLEGSTITTTIIPSGGSPNPATVANFASSNQAVATIEGRNTTAECDRCKAVVISCKKAGSVSLTAKSSTGVTAQATVKVLKKESTTDTGSIEFTQSNYTCTAGSTIKTTITPSGNATVASFASNDTTIATITADTTTSGCANCKNVVITCKKEGIVGLTAKSSTGATGNAQVKVTASVGTIKFDENSYTCSTGDKIEAIITAEHQDSRVTVAEYKSENENIATVVAHPYTKPKCMNCTAVLISCKKAGKVKLTATSSAGATTTTSVTIDNNGGISFVKDTYQCTAGKTLTAYVITPYTTLSKVGLKDASTTDMASISIGEMVDSTAANRKYSVKVECKKTGNVMLTATSANNKKAYAPLTVVRQTAFFQESSFTCSAGKTKTIVLNITSGTVLSIGSNDTTIATIEETDKTGYYKVSCKKAGATRVFAIMSNGYKANASVNVN